MVITNSSSLLDPTELPLTEIARDWFGSDLGPRPSFGFAVDPGQLHFRAARSGPAHVHPDAAPGAFTAELWKYDAAEFFIGHPDEQRYLEFNLAPNGAWWSCLFSAPRCRLCPDDHSLPGVVTAGGISESGWEATASVPLSVLREELGIDRLARLNATFTLDPPDQRFFTHAPLGPGEPDFHQPARLPLVNL